MWPNNSCETRASPRCNTSRKMEPSGIEMSPASGEANISMDFVAPIIIQLDAGGPIVLLAGGHVGCFELFGTDRVRSIHDLKGKTVAVFDLQLGPISFISSMAAYVVATNLFRSLFQRGCQVRVIVSSWPYLRSKESRAWAYCATSTLGNWSGATPGRGRLRPGVPSAAAVGRHVSVDGAGRGSGAELHPAVSDADGAGPRPVATRVLVALALLKPELHCSDEQLRSQLRTDLAVMYACGLTQVQGNRAQDPFVLPELLTQFRSRLEDPVLEELLALQAAAALEQGGVSPAHLVVDTFPSEPGSPRVTEAATL